MAPSFPIQTSAVYVLGSDSSRTAAMPPASPPSPKEALFGDKDLPSRILSLSSSSSSASLSGSGAHRVALPSPITTAQASGPGSPCLTALDAAAGEESSDLEMDASSIVTATTTTTATATTGSCMSPAEAARRKLRRRRLAGAFHVLSTEAHALASVAALYGRSGSVTARDGFAEAVDAIVQTQTAYPPGKLVIVGVGKSGHIGNKLTATFNSLAVPSSFVHPTEALHGDLGHICPHDAVLFITYSGKTQELASLLPHIDPVLPLILLTAHVTAETCALIQRRKELQQAQIDARVGGGPAAAAIGPTILVPAPIPVEEKVSFGVSAPTTSTTTALAVGDALAIVTGNELHAAMGGVGSVFQKNHPGGAIGDATRKQGGPGGPAMRHLAVPWSQIPVVKADAPAVDVLRAGYHNSAAVAKGWVRVVQDTNSAEDDGSVGVAPPSRIRALDAADLGRSVADVAGHLVVAQPDFVVVAADTKAASTADWLRRSTASGDVASNAVLAVVDHNKGRELIGVLELDDLLQL